MAKAKAIARPHIDINSAAVLTQRTSNVVAFAEIARNASAIFAIAVMLAHRAGQLKMPRPDAYISTATAGIWFWEVRVMQVCYLAMACDA